MHKCSDARSSICEQAQRMTTGASITVSHDAVKTKQPHCVHTLIALTQKLYGTLGQTRHCGTRFAQL
eukprot:2985-Heterococcus_DN1.PRE.2